MDEGVRGEIWVSAVLYIAMGIVVISLLLASLTPLIQKMRDRNTVVQTKELLFTLDQTIKAVAREGPGSQRELSPVVVKEGRLAIDAVGDVVSWTMETGALVSEPDVAIPEGVVTMLTESTPVVDKYRVYLNLSYSGVADLVIVSPYQGPFVGEYAFSVRHTGNFTPGAVADVPVVAVHIR